MTEAKRVRERMGRRERLTRTGDFRLVYAHRARAADDRLVVYARPNGSAVTRLGVSAGRRCGGAVARNRTKRLVREAFRRARAGWPAGYDVVVVPLGGGYTLAEVDGRLRRLVPAAIRRCETKRAADASRKEGPPS